MHNLRIWYLLRALILFLFSKDGILIIFRKLRFYEKPVSKI